LQRQGRAAESVVAFQQANAIAPNNAAGHLWLGVGLATLDRMGEAMVEFRKTIQLDPNSFEGYYNLALSLHYSGDMDEAISMHEKALQLSPNSPLEQNNLGNSLKDVGWLDEAMARYEKAYTLNPPFEPAWCNRLFTLYFHPKSNAQSILREHEHWNQKRATALFDPAPHPNTRDPQRRLRIGYVGADFRNHCQSFFTIPLFSNHDHKAFEIFCYASVQRPDDATKRIRGLVDIWRDCLPMTDAQLAETIRNDKIDILIDLTMHMANGRPLLFARKPAPIQIAWLAYPGTTGLKTMDYRLTDPQLEVSGCQLLVASEDEGSHLLATSNQQLATSASPQYSEKSIALPHTFWCFDPLTDNPTPNALPALSNGFITFGCLNNFCKVNDGVLALWAKVMQAIPNSRFILLTPRGRHRQRLFQFLDPQRVELVEFTPREKYFRHYHRIDIGLDTFPYNGHTTSLDSFWMGVPVVSLCGSTPISRAGFSQATNLGLADLLVANDENQFVDLAVSLSGDLDRLSRLRAELRQRLTASPLMNAPKFARDMEAVYRAVWQKYCS
jgi:predicted O-linked N-acetylglucosamine transferase (SPINDLY family)